MLIKRQYDGKLLISQLVSSLANIYTDVTEELELSFNKILCQNNVKTWVFLKLNFTNNTSFSCVYSWLFETKIF